ncbi:hypothetical protein C7212DRAFT_340012 [Tuber magnatum]|uniref:Uncharacterized protein n=1 Tax=Tuber magnatum TaxID=42249 RepID=A0A317SXJ9_9PEZI|nr:hypothetical protein C7212DRAFT_340012 [Tuber magnatum]
MGDDRRKGPGSVVWQDLGEGRGGLSGLKLLSLLSPLLPVTFLSPSSLRELSVGFSSLFRRRVIMEYFNLPNPGQAAAYFSPLASNDPYEGRTAGHSRYGHRESREMMLSPGSFAPDGLQTTYSSLSRGHQQMLGRDFFASNQRWKLVAKITASFFLGVGSLFGTGGVGLTYVNFPIVVVQSYGRRDEVENPGFREVQASRGRPHPQPLQLPKRLGIVADFCWTASPMLCLLCLDTTGNSFHEDRGVEPDYGVQESTAHLYGDIATYFMYGVPGTPDTYVNPYEYGTGPKLCGPRCSPIYIFQWVDETWEPPSETGSFFNCTITVSQVQNANPLQPFHSMPDLTAEIAGAIGLDGYIDDSSRQFVRYTSASTWGQRMTNSTDYAELLVGKYATGVIAAYDIYGPSVEAMGLQSRPGVSLSVNWFYVSLTLGCILGAQFVCGMFVIYSSNSVFCKDDSYLSTARLLRPLVERLGNSGSTSTGLEISQTFTRSVRYGVRSDFSSGQPIHHLDVGEDIEKLARFPEGHYN